MKLGTVGNMMRLLLRCRGTYIHIARGVSLREYNYHSESCKNFKLMYYYLTLTPNATTFLVQHM